MIRKVIKQANQAYTLTLPIDWVRKNQIDKKSEVNVEVVEKSLIVNSTNPVVGGKVKINLNDINIKSIYRIIGAFYAKGIDEIEINSKKDISRELIGSLNQNLGYALVYQKDDVYIIKDVKGRETQDLDEIFKRVFQMLLLFYESAIKDIYGEEKETLDGLKNRDSEVNKFCFYLQRAINKMSYPDMIKGRALFTYSFELEKIGDEINRLWRTNIKYNVQKNPKIKELMGLSLDCLGKAFELYYQFNIKNINEVYKIREDVREKSLKLTNINAKTSRFLRHVVKIVEDAADLSHLTLMINL